MNIDEEKLEELLIDAKDAAIFTGLVYFASKRQDDPKFDSASFMGFTLLPSPFPKTEFDIAVDLQKHWNYLLHRCSNDRQFIYESLKSVIESNSFIAKLWNICDAVFTEGIVQPITLNIMRVDYFLDANKLKMGDSNQTFLSNIEINTLGCGACAVPSKIVDLHRYMLHKTNNDQFITKLAPNNLHKNIVDGLIEAWRLYKNPNAHLLLVVRDLNFNFGDHRLLEYLMFELEPSIRFIRMTLTQIYKTARLEGKDKRLFIGDDEIAIVYFKAGFNPDNYPTENEWTARLLIEKSKAIKAPKIEYQLMCAKKFQQYLSEPNTIERFIQDEKTANLLRATFVKQYSFDKDKEKNSQLFEICLNQYEKFVLKPQLEGGGNNIWGENIKKTIESIKKTQDLYSYILMERIEPVRHLNYLITAGAKTSNVSVDSELGIYGISIGDHSNEMIKNECGGYALFTKEAKSNEWGETLGSGTFDSIWFSS